jgi:hypothetical protein
MAIATYRLIRSMTSEEALSWHAGFLVWNIPHQLGKYPTIMGEKAVSLRASGNKMGDGKSHPIFRPPFY